MISYGLVVFMPVLVLYIVSYSKVATILEHNLLYSATQSYEQTYSFASYKLYKMIRSSDLIHSDEMIHRILTSQSNTTSIVQQVDDMYLLQKYLTSYEDMQDIEKVRLYVPSSFIYSQEGINFLDQSTITSTLWYKYLNEQDKKILFAPSDYLTDTPDRDILSIIRPIYQLDNFNVIEGYLRIDFSKKILLDIVEKSTPSLNSFTLILNDNGVPVLSSNNDLITKYGLSSVELRPFSNYSTQYHLQSLKNKSFYIQSRLIPNTDWSIISVIPKDEILSTINAQRRILAIALVVMLSFAAGLAYLISHYMTKRLDTLTDHMKNIGETNFMPPQFEEDQDEIGVLAKSYNHMLNQIQGLMDEQYASGIKIKSAELKAIQAQINPHFLYNTLEMINWMAKKQEIDRILLVTKELSRFYKLSLNKGNDLITLRDEFAHLNAYITIQNLRFENKITFHAHLNPEIAKFIVPKIILQPLIENAIMHGILEKPDQQGILTVSAEIDTSPNSMSTDIESNVIITIADNGIGMTEQKIALLFNSVTSLSTKDLASQNNQTDPFPEDADSKGSHYGINNIKERLELFYGQNAHISATSKLGEGTTIKLKIPYQR